LFHRHTESSLPLFFTHAVPSKTPMFAHTDRKDVFGLYTKKIVSRWDTH